MKLLFVDCCVRGVESRTMSLCRYFIEEVRRKNTTISAQWVRVYEEPLKPLNAKSLKLRDELIRIEQLEHPMFQYANQFANADVIIVGAPYWDLSFPACLKTYIEQICVTDITFTYTESGSVGLCKAKKMMYISTVGGILSEAHAGEMYIKQLCKFLGIKTCETYSLQGIDIQGVDVAAKMKQAKGELGRLADKFKADLK